MIVNAPAGAQMPDAIKGLALEIPATKYTLKNGLTLIVHEDRKAPIVAVQVWYKVGARDEPPGRSGFAHLFEHLMFNGSEHNDTDWFKPARAMGATNINGTTNPDRTNYFQTVPKGALDAILWMEADRMGHFLGAVTQAKLDEQRGVVQNEKRQGENQPYALAYELTVKRTYPPEHPYGHTVIGSMEDLNAASLEDVRAWFRAWYGPSNAIIVLSGDITPAEGLAKVERAFGHIPPGPPVTRAKAWTAKRSGEARDLAYDQVAQPRLSMTWNIPHAGESDTIVLGLLADALTGGRTSRLYKRLVHDEQVATNAYAYTDLNEIASQFVITVEIKPEADIAKVEAAVDEELARLLAAGPTKAEMDRARTAMAGDMARRMESAFRKSSMLVQAESQYGDPQAWRRHFDVTMAATPTEVQAAAKLWLTDGVYILTILPRPAFAAAAPANPRPTRVPEASATAAPGFPALERAELPNGLKLIVASRRAAPIISLSLQIEPGFSAEDARSPAGTRELTLDLMDEGTASRTGLEISDALRALGAELSVDGGDERAAVSLSTLSATLDPALAIFADVTLNPAFRAEDLERVRRQAIVGVESERRQPRSAGPRALRPILFGGGHPYGRLTTEDSLRAFSREDAIGYHRRWITPDNATLIVTGDTTMADIRPKIEKAFAGWRTKAAERLPVPDAPKATPGIYVVDRPGAQQSYILGAATAPRWNAEDEIALALMNDAFGGTFTSRLNMNLREEKGWSYGVRSTLAMTGRGPRAYQMSAPVQTDKTLDSLLELKREFTELAGARPITAAELAQVQNDTTLAMPGQWETLAAVSAGIGELAYRGLPDDYWATYAARVKAARPEDLARVAAKVIRPPELVWVVVGDREKIVPELARRNLGPVRIVDGDGNLVK